MKIVFYPDGFKIDAQYQMAVQEKLLRKLGRNRQLIEENDGVVKVFCEPNEDFDIDVEGVPEKVHDKVILDWKNNK